MSTLEVAWEHNPLWRVDGTRTDFCWKVAQTNKLELLKWAREEKKCSGIIGRLMRPQTKVIWKW